MGSEMPGALVETPTHSEVCAPNDALCGISDIGGREKNEDAFFLSPLGPFMVVADGMGGHQAGEVASEIAIKTLAEFFDEGRGGSERGGQEAEALLVAAFEEAHRRVAEAARSDATRSGMGTTLIAGLIDGSRLYTCHVGDVRCYVRSSKGLEQITRDHSVVAALVRAGQLTDEEARTHELRNRIDQALGLPMRIVPELHCVELSPGDRVLLCSDGLWGALRDEEIREVVDWEGTARQRAMQLVNRARSSPDADDNITVVLYDLAGETPH